MKMLTKKRKPRKRPPSSGVSRQQFEEHEHPRGPGGRFADKPGGGDKPSQRPTGQGGTDKPKRPKVATRLVYNKGSRKALKRLKLNGKQATRISGAPRGVHVEITPDRGGVLIQWSGTHRDGGWVKAIRRIVKSDVDGKRILQAESVEFSKELHGKGHGTRMFGRMVDHARAAGLARIETIATRGGGLNGYYTWARLGYDGKTKAGALVSSHMATPEGREFWKANGYSFDAKFDLSDGSQSMKVFNAYRKAKGI